MEARTPMVSDVRRIIEDVDAVKYRQALMYQFLVGGEVSQVCDKYAPTGKDAKSIDLQIHGKNIKAALFFVKNVKPKFKGKFRVCAVPLDSQFEPWTQPILELFESCGDKRPFKFCMRSLQRVAQEKFEGYIWPKDEYQRPTGEKVERRYNPFRLGDLNKLRRKNLIEFYHFDEVDLALFGAWNVPVIDVRKKTEIENILSTDIKLDDITSLRKSADRYFAKLLKPLNELDKETIPFYEQIRESVYLSKRYESASDIIESIQNINILGQGKFDVTFFRENMRLILEILSPCESKAEFTSKIANLATLFEVDLNSLRKLVKEVDDKRSIKLIETWLLENNIRYQREIFETWHNINIIRNMEVHAETNPKKLMQLLKYFGEPMSLPPNYPHLWEKILDKFIISITHFQNILNKISPTI